MHPFALKMYGQIEELLCYKNTHSNSRVVDEEAGDAELEAKV